MAAATVKRPGFFIYGALLVTLVFISSASSQCVDGDYEHEGRRCCKCAKGLKVVEHCTQNLQQGKCEPCDAGTYSSHPSNEKTCITCTDCTHSNENLEVETPCTISSDAKCRCKENHYCTSGVETCKICQPCSVCGREGVKIECVGRNDTVCNDIVKWGKHVAIIVGILVPLALIATLVLCVLWKLRKIKFRKLNLLRRRPHKAHEMEHLTAVPDVDIQPLIPDIAGVLGWKDMRDVALRSKTPMTTIESCQLDHPGDAEQQTVKLLSVWAEREGRAAPQKLIHILRKSCKRAKEEKVMDILLNANEPNAVA